MGFAWGEEAAKLYFGKKTKQLTLAEAATPGPPGASLCSPYSNPRRQNSGRKMP